MIKKIKYYDNPEVTQLKQHYNLVIIVFLLQTLIFVVYLLGWF
jgi:hypothetical protein